MTRGRSKQKVAAWVRKIRRVFGDALAESEDWTKASEETEAFCKALKKQHPDDWALIDHAEVLARTHIHRTVREYKETTEVAND